MPGDASVWMPDGSEPAIVEYRLERHGRSIDMIVTKGRLAGRSARLIPTDPSAAYFNLRGVEAEGHRVKPASRRA